MRPFLLLILTQCGKNRIPLTRANFESSQFVSDGSKENFLVYALACRHEISFFTINNFREPKLAKALFISSQIES